MQDFDFGTVENAVAFFKSKVDDIEKVIVHTAPLVITRDGVETDRIPSNCGLIVCMVGGGKFIVPKETAEAMLNDGILSRLRIKIELGANPFGAPGNQEL